jgi:hypothetical protein
MFMPGIPQVWYLDILRVKIIMKQLIMVVVQVIKKLIGQLTKKDIVQGFKTNVVQKQLEII